MSFNPTTGEFVCDGCGTAFPFLPAVAAESAPFEFIHAACGLPDPSNATKLEAVVIRDDDAHKAALATGTQAANRHHEVDAQAVADWYESRGEKFERAGGKDAYVAASKAHADKVAKIRGGAKIDPKTGEPIEPPAPAAAGEQATTAAS